jgi:putative CocE/NonD family hydrolase
MQWLGASIACLSILLCGCQQLVNYSMLPREGIRPAEYSVRVERDIVMTTTDEVALVANIYHPQTDQPAPTILVRIPFTKTFKNDLGANAMASFWASRGYTVVVQGTRGRYKSGGTYYPMRHERQDGIETLRWLSKQPWFDGRLGMWGGSAFGYTQWVLADQKFPGPNALAIQIASTDFHGMFYPGGAFSLESALFWAVRSRGAKDEDPSFKFLQKGFDGFPLIEADDRAVRDIGFFNDWVSHKEADAYWKELDGENRARDILAPVLLMAGWSDPFLPTQLQDYITIQRAADKRVAEQSRLIIGPWMHADSMVFPDGTTTREYRAASLAPTISWFDHHLLGRPLDSSLAAPIRLYVMGANIWRDEQEWPLARAKNTAFYLHSQGNANSRHGDGRLSLSLPTANEPGDTYIYDPLRPVPSKGGAMLGPRAGMQLQTEVEERQDVLVYSTDPLEHDTEVTGPVSAVLYVETSATNTDFTVKLVDVHPDGKAYNVSDGILRRDYPVHASRSLPHEIRIELWPTSMQFRQGHRIRVEVSSSNYPRYDRNPNTGRPIPTETAPVSARQRVHHSPNAPSRIILPLIPR